MSLEDSPEAFFERFKEAAFVAEVLPVPWGWPLVEVETPLGPLRAMDRGAPPLKPGNHTLLLHGVVAEISAEKAEGEFFKELKEGAYLFAGPVRELQPGFYLMRSVVPVLLYSETPLPASPAVVTHPPLMGFRP